MCRRDCHHSVSPYSRWSPPRCERNCWLPYYMRIEPRFHHHGFGDRHHHGFDARHHHNDERHHHHDERHRVHFHGRHGSPFGRNGSPSRRHPFGRHSSPFGRHGRRSRSPFGRHGSPWRGRGRSGFGCGRFSPERDCNNRDRRSELPECCRSERRRVCDDAGEGPSGRSEFPKRGRSSSYP